MSEQPTQQTNANNNQGKHNGNSNNEVLSATACPHGTSNFVTWARSAADVNAAAVKAASFQNHQRIFSACNCTLT